MPEPISDQSGFLLIDKPEGITSFDVIRKLRKITSVRKMGHIGTLDPFATGLMIYSLNRYTRLCNLMETADKTYEVKMLFGISTDSGDKTGKVIQSLAPQDLSIDQDKLQSLAEEALKLEKLPIPQYSAVKINGKRAYQYARENIHIEIPDREVKIHSFELLDFTHPYLSYRCRVSKGTYIRSLSEWIAGFLGTIGHTTELRRSAINTTNISEAVELDKLTPENWQQYFYPPHLLLSGFSSLILDAESVQELLAGRTVVSTGIDEEQILIFDQTLAIRSVATRRTATLYPKMNLV